MTGKVVLGRYQIVRLLGQGGMGQVYLAWQKNPPREVVVKVMHEHLARTPRFRQDFERETRLMARFKHPHAVEMYEASLDDPAQPCIVMEYVRGEDLKSLVERQGPFAPLRVGRLLGQLCSVLQAAHDAGILHRDLTAANLMVIDAGQPGESLKVMDFGLARGGGGPYFAMAKLTGNVDSIGGGTPDYVSPEQVRGEEIDHRSDLYSVGVVLFMLLTGKLPFEDATSTEAILLAHAERTPPSFAAVNPRVRVPPGLETVVRGCLAKYPNERPGTAKALGEQFEKALGQRIMLDYGTAQIGEASLTSQPRPEARDVVDRLEAWMPESIAIVKLRGFIGDLGGEVIESEPGLVRVRLPGPGEPAAAAPPPRGLLGWLGLGRASEPATPMALMELHMQKVPGAGNQLAIEVVMRPERADQGVSRREWQEWCGKVCRDLRAYLISR